MFKNYSIVMSSNQQSIVSSQVNTQQRISATLGLIKYTRKRINKQKHKNGTVLYRYPGLINVNCFRKLCLLDI